MRLRVLALAALASASGAAAQPVGPYKLVIAWGNGQTPPVVIDYPSQVRCEAAARAVEREARRREEWAESRPRPPGTITMGGPVVFYAFCIPG